VLLELDDTELRGALALLIGKTAALESNSQRKLKSRNRHFFAKI